MSTDRNVLQMGPIKDKLRNLKDIVPGQEEVFYQFANYLADSLNPELVPAGFYIAIELSISGCKEGYSGFGRSLRGSFVGLSYLKYYTWKEIIINSVADIIFPAEFATELKEFHRHVIKSMDEKKEKEKNNMISASEIESIFSEKQVPKEEIKKDDEESSSEFGKNMELEISLLDYRGETNKNAQYQINEDESGIYLQQFLLGSLQMKVEDIVSYIKWQWGKVNRGAGQVGVYRLTDQNGKKYFALIKDYRAFEGDWRIMLINIRDDEAAFKQWLESDALYGKEFSDYLGMGGSRISF